MSVYLNEKGITSTSANHLANLAKESIKEAEAILDNISFVNKRVELINGEKKDLRINENRLPEISTLLNRISNMHAFCAWVREAIKEKESLLSEIDHLDLAKFCKIKEIELPEFPTRPLVTTTEEVMREMNIKEKNRYLTLEAFASTYGEYIHPGGSIANAREDFYKRLNVPNETSGSGRDMVIYSYSPVVSQGKLDSTYLALQESHRKYEKELNAIKYQVKEEANRRNSVAQAEFNKEYSVYSAEIEKLNNALAAYKIKGREEIVNLKIVIPDSLKETYEYLEALGK